MDTFKIISIIFMMIVIYQIYQLNCTVYKDNREDFEGTTQNLGGVDDTNAINTLAQIAKNLMAGGVTVPGNMGLLGSMTFNNAGANFITINKGTKSDPQTIHVWNSDSQLLLVGKNDANNDYSWPGIVLDTKKSNINTNSINVAGAINAGGLSVGGNTNLGNFTIKKGTNSPDNSKIQWGDGTGWRLRFQKDDSNPTMDIYDNGSVNITRSLIVGGRDILAELNALNAKTANLNLGDYTVGPESDYLVIRRRGHDGRWAYRTGTNWG